MRKANKKVHHNDDVWMGLIAGIVTLALCIPGSAKTKCEFDGGVYLQAYERCIHKAAS
jgi:hypothetical protein